MTENWTYWRNFPKLSFPWLFEDWTIAHFSNPRKKKKYFVNASAILHWRKNVKNASTAGKSFQKPFVLKIRLNSADVSALWIFIQAHFWCDLWLPATVGDRHLEESAEEVEEEAPKEIDRWEGYLIGPNCACNIQRFPFGYWHSPRNWA